jgi:hypothetical protein
MRQLLIRGQARIMEAIAATVIILVLALLMPILFKTPTTTLQSEVQVSEEEYAYNVLYDVYANPQFLNYISQGDWSAFRPLMNSVIGPQYNWFLCIEPIDRVLNISSSVTHNYVAIPLQIISSQSGIIPYPYVEVKLNIKTFNLLLPPGFTINTTWPLSNVFFTTQNNTPIHWWLQRYNPITGDAILWLNTPPTKIIMYVSKNGTYPYNPISNTYCKTPYCPSYGGLSAFEAASVGAPVGLDNGAHVFNLNYGAQYFGFNSVNTQCIGATPSTPLVLSTSEGSSASCSSNFNVAVVGPLEINYISMPISEIPGSSLSLSSNVVVSIINTTSDTTIATTSIPISVTYTYGSSHEYITLTVGSNTETASGTYVYLSSSRLIITPTTSSCSGGININVTVSLLIHNYLTGTNTLLQISSTQCILTSMTQQGLLSIVPVVRLNRLSITQSSPSQYEYVYNTVNTIYDLWVAPSTSVSYITPVYTNYACIDNVIPPQYAYRFPGIPFTPTAEAFTVVQLPNGSYYLVMIGLQRLGGG